MSVCNLSVTPSRILILSDTLQYRGGEPVSFCDSKTAISKAGGYAHTLRGPALVADFIQQALDSVTALHEAVGAVTGVLEAVDPETIAACRGIEATLAGKLQPSGQLVAVRVRRMQGMLHPETVTLRAGVHLLPTGEGLDALLPPEADEKLMVRLALAQWKVREHFTLPLCIGGIMHLTEVTPAGARQWVAGEYPDHDAVRAQLAAAAPAQAIAA